MITKSRKRREQRDSEIVKIYLDETAKGSQKMAIYDHIANTFGISINTVVAAIKKALG